MFHCICQGLIRELEWLVLREISMKIQEQVSLAPARGNCAQRLLDRYPTYSEFGIGGTVSPV